MSDLTLYFDCDPGADPEALGRDLQERLQQLENVTAAETSVPATRFTGLEILAAIALAPQIVHGVRVFTDDVPSIAERLKPLFAKVVAVFAGKPGVRQVSVPVGLEKKPIDQLTDEDYQRIATRLAKLLQAKSNPS